MGHLYAGARSRFAFEVRNDLVTPSALADPTTLSVTIAPTGVDAVTYVYPVDPDLIRDSLGLFHLDYTMAVAGSYQVTAQAFGAIVAVSKFNFHVWP